MLYIVRDKTNKLDINSNRFEKALVKECNKQGIGCQVVDKIIDATTPTIVFEPTKVKSKTPYNNVDQNTTAKVVFNIVKELQSKAIALIGYGNVVGKPLHEMLGNVSLIRSSTPKGTAESIIEDSEVVIIAVPPIIGIPYDLSGKIVIDVTGRYKGDPKEYIGVKVIGKRTVEMIVSNSI